MKWTNQKTVALLGTMLLIPWDLYMAFGYSFSFPSNPPLLERVFVCVTFYLTLPAVLISWLFPKLGAYWILLNTTISVLIVAAQRINWYLEFRRKPYELAHPLPIAIVAQIFYVGAFFWGGKLAFSLGILHYGRDSQRRARSDTSPK